MSNQFDASTLNPSDLLKFMIFQKKLDNVTKMTIILKSFLEYDNIPNKDFLDTLGSCLVDLNQYIDQSDLKHPEILCAAELLKRNTELYDMILELKKL